jgi:hypothetical protein
MVKKFGRLHMPLNQKNEICSEMVVWAHVQLFYRKKQLQILL